MAKALIFDVFGSVVDWRTGVAREVERFFASKDVTVDAPAFADAWRAEYDPAMAAVRDGGRGYVPLDILHRENLDKVLADFGLDETASSDERVALNRAWEKLPPWPDSVSGLTRLKTRYAIAPCSNGSIALMTWLAKFGGLPWDAILGAEIARDYKPKPDVYIKSARAFGLEPGSVIMAAAHNNDLDAARSAGLKTAFFPRPTERGTGQTIDLEATSDWDFVARDLDDLADQLLD